MAELATFATAVEDHQRLLARMTEVLPALDEVAQRLIATFASGGRLLAIGNGGSACDAQHLAEELVARYRRQRRALPALALAADPAVLTCIGNDFGFDEVFARQIEAHARPGDAVAAFSTSGRSPNVVRALQAAREADAWTILFAGGDGGPAAAHADHALLVPSDSTARIQEMHVLMLHLLLEPIDRWAAAEPGEGDAG